jgi:hypothetical protein
MVAAQAEHPCETELELRIIGVKFQGSLIGFDCGREVTAPQAGDRGLFQGRGISRELAPGFGGGRMGSLA